MCTLDSDANVTLRVDKTSQLDTEPIKNDIITEKSDLEWQIRGLSTDYKVSKREHFQISLNSEMSDCCSIRYELREVTHSQDEDFSKDQALISLTEDG